MTVNRRASGGSRRRNVDPSAATPCTRTSGGPVPVTRKRRGTARSKRPVDNCPLAAALSSPRSRGSDRRYSVADLVNVRAKLAGKPPAARAGRPELGLRDGQRGGEPGRVLEELEEPELGQATGELELVVVDRLTGATEARHDDRARPVQQGEVDRANAGMRDDDARAADQLLELREREVVDIGG